MKLRNIETCPFEWENVNHLAWNEWERVGEITSLLEVLRIVNFSGPPSLSTWNFPRRHFSLTDTCTKATGQQISIRREWERKNRKKKRKKLNYVDCGCVVWLIYSWKKNINKWNRKKAKQDFERSNGIRKKCEKKLKEFRWSSDLPFRYRHCQEPITVGRAICRHASLICEQEAQKSFNGCSGLTEQFQCVSVEGWPSIEAHKSRPGNEGSKEETHPLDSSFIVKSKMRKVEREKSHKLYRISWWSPVLVASAWSREKSINGF